MNPSSISFNDASGDSGSCQSNNKSKSRTNECSPTSHNAPSFQHRPMAVVVDDARSHFGLGNDLASVIDSKAQVTQVAETVLNPKPANNRCLSKELLTCLALSSIVVGLPIAIIIVLINLPKMSTRRDTRQQHYVLLAFGFPFSLVMIVSFVYAIFRLVMRIRTGPDHSKLLRSRMSWRRFSRRLRRGLNQPTNLHYHHNNRRHHSPHYLHSHHGPPFSEPSSIPSGSSLHNIDIEDRYSGDSLRSSQTTIDNEPKLYSLVAEILANQQQEQRKNSFDYREYAGMSRFEHEGDLPSPQSIHRVYSNNTVDSHNPNSLNVTNLPDLPNFNHHHLHLYQQHHHQDYAEGHQINCAVPPSPPERRCSRHSINAKLYLVPN